MKIFCNIFILSIIIFGWHESRVDGYLTLLGRSNLNVENVRAMMEIYVMYNRGFNYYFRRFCWLDKYVEDFNSGPVKNENKFSALRNEINYLFASKYSGRELTDLFVILIVQFVSSVNAMQFAYGHLYYEERHNESDSKSCAELAYYLACLGFSTESTSDAISRILKKKYPKASKNFQVMSRKLIYFQIHVKSVVAILYDHDMKRIDDLQREDWDDSDLEEAVKYINRYFRRMLFGENVIPSEEPVDLRADSELWTKAGDFVEYLKDTEHPHYYDKDSGAKTMFLSNWVKILQEIDFLKAQKVNAHSNVINGLTKGYLVVMPRPYSQTAVSEFVFKVSLKFKLDQRF